MNVIIRQGVLDEQVVHVTFMSTDNTNLAMLLIQPQQGLLEDIHPVAQSIYQGRTSTYSTSPTLHSPADVCDFLLEALELNGNIELEHSRHIAS